MQLRSAIFLVLLLFRSSLAEGLNFSAEYTADVLTVVSGGLSTGSEYLDKLDLELDIDVGRTWESGSGRIFAHGLYNNGATFSAERVGDLQVVSNIDAARAWRLFELWFEVGSADWTVKTGLYDLNSEFDVNETGAIFLNSSHGIGAEFGQTGQNGPSIFPVSSVAIRGAIHVDSITARIAVLDAVPGNPDDASSNRVALDDDDGILTVAELDLSYSRSARLWLGYWRYSAEFERPYAAGSSRGNDGWYIGNESSFQLGSRAAAWFVRFGMANEDLNSLSSYIGVGAVISGPFAARPADQLGFAVASARGGDPYRDYLDRTGAGAGRRETSWELTYQLQLNGHLLIQPNIQYVQNTSVATLLDDVWVVGCRFQIRY